MKKRALFAGCACAFVMGAWTMDVRAGDSPEGISANLELVSDYRFRGLAQTNGKPALQGGFDYEHAGGFYAGVWGSNISWLSDGADDISSSVEVDVYLGYAVETDAGVSFDIGVSRYLFPGSYPAGFNKADTTEGMLSVGWGPVALNYARAFGDLFGFDDSSGSDYISLSLEQGFGDGWTVSAHYGQQTVRGNREYDYDDWGVGIAKDLSGGFSVGLAWSDTNADRDLYTNAFGRNTAGSAVVLSIAKSF